MAMRNFLRFIFSGADVSMIDVDSIVTEDITMNPGDPTIAPAMHSLKINFDQTVSTPVQIRPLFPGEMFFVAEHNPLKILPAAGDVTLTDAAYNTWNTTGTLMIRLDSKYLKPIEELDLQLPAIPNVVWYNRVTISKEFLFETLTLRLSKTPISKGTTTIRRNHPDWIKHAIEGFLGGVWAPKLQLMEDVGDTEDQVMKYPMPTVTLGAGNAVELTITIASRDKPQDGPKSDFDGGLDSDPGNPQYGIMPARLVHLKLWADMVSDPGADDLRAAILPVWPSAGRYWQIAFTRTWEHIPNCSWHFTQQNVRIMEGTSILTEERIPCHGVVFIPQDPSQAAVPAPTISIEVVGYMKWLLGSTPDAWRVAAREDPVDIDLAAVADPHVILRLPMSMAIFSDIKYNDEVKYENLCTYFSLRRIVRALVDNRIAGGRLNFRVKDTGPITEGLISRAWRGLGIAVDIVANNKPNPQGPPSLALNLLPILSAFFDDPAGEAKGTLSYYIWQSWREKFNDAATRSDYPDAFIGRGGPGAAVYLGLATFQVEPSKNPGESDGAFRDRIVGLMTANLRPGAVLQFWEWNEDFDKLKNRNPASLKGVGHSPIFKDYVRDDGGNITGMIVVDQYGNKKPHLITGTATAHNRILPWGYDTWTYEPEVWLAANWSE